MRHFRIRTFGLIIVAASSFVQAHQRTAVPQWETEIRAFEESDTKNPPEQDAVLFVGSSSVRLWESLETDFPSTKVIKRGFGGSEIADSTHYADRIIIPYRPRLIVLYAGDNDLANGRSPDQVVEDFEAFVSRVRRDLPKVKVAFIAIKPSPARSHLLAKAKAANERIKQIASSADGLLYIDVFTPMLTASGGVRPELFIEDGLHLNREGYRLWATVIGPHLK